MYRLVNNVLRDTKHNLYIRKSFESYFHGLASVMDASAFRYKLPRELEKDFVEYYRSFGFKYVPTYQLQLVYALTGEYDRRLIPDYIFNNYIDPVYPEIRDFWQNKSYQRRIVPAAVYPENIVRNINGYYVDNDEQLISADKAVLLIHSCDRVVIKPAIRSGGGLNVRFFKGTEVDKNVLSSYGKNFIVQEKMKQSAFMASFNSSSVNTDKIISFLYKGDVYILSSLLRVGQKGRENDNFTGNYGGGFIAKINPDGSLAEYGYDGYFNRVYRTGAGIPLSAISVPFHTRCTGIIKNAHKYLLDFPFVSWDFAQREDGEPVLIEYNLKWHSPFHFQLCGGPLLKDFTEDVLKEAAPLLQQNKGLFK